VNYWADLQSGARVSLLWQHNVSKLIYTTLFTITGKEKQKHKKTNKQQKNDKKST